MQDVHGRLLVPVSYLPENLCLAVAWESETRQITMRGGCTELVATLGSPLFLVNGTVQIAPTSPTALQGLTSLPAAYVLQQLGYIVTEDSGDLTAVYSRSFDHGQISLYCTPDPQAAANEKTVTISHPEQAMIRQYRLGAGPWQQYTGPFVVRENLTVHAQAADLAGMVYVGHRRVLCLDASCRRVQADGYLEYWS
jgi:hypothetical protein